MKVVLVIVLALLFIGCDEKQQEEKKEEVKERISIAKASIEEKTSSIVSSVKDSTAYVVEAVVPEKIDGAVLYASCAGCHGKNGEKQALGKSKAIQGWDTQRTIDALNGYSDGSYGGALKGMMKSQADKLNTKETEAIAKYISKL